MTRRIRIYPYKTGSGSAKSLAERLSELTGRRVLRLKREGSRFRSRPTDLIINWGSTDNPWIECDTINRNLEVSSASDKIQCLRILSEAGIPVPNFTTDRRIAEEIVAAGHTLVCRTLTRANSGRGIVIAETLDQIVEAPLYTQYIKKLNEYRIHVFNGEVIDVQRKMRRRDVPDDEVNWQVRNHSNGFIFGREGVVIPEYVLTRAIESIAALNLTFGAVDIIHNAQRDEYYVLEINTAPGLEGQTLTNYVEAIREYTNRPI